MARKAGKSKSKKMKMMQTAIEELQRDLAAVKNPPMATAEPIADRYVYIDGLTSQQITAEEFQHKAQRGIPAYMVTREDFEASAQAKIDDADNNGMEFTHSETGTKIDNDQISKLVRSGASVNINLTR